MGLQPQTGVYYTHAEQGQHLVWVPYLTVQNSGSDLGVESQHWMSVSYYEHTTEQCRLLQSKIQIVKNCEPPYMDVRVVSGQQSTGGPWENEANVCVLLGTLQGYPHKRSRAVQILLKYCVQRVGRCLHGPFTAISSPQDPPLGLVPAKLVSGLVPSFGSELHLLREGSEDAADCGGDPQWHLPAGPQPAGWKLKRLICVQVPGRCSRGKHTILLHH